MLAKRGPAVALALAMLALAAFGAAAWTTAHPPTTTVTDRANVQHVALDTSGRATVTGDGALHDPGTVLENPVVYPRAAPDLVFTARTGSANASFARVTQNVTLVYTATRDDETFWTRTVPLGSNATTDAANVTTTARIDTERVRGRLAAYRAAAGDAGSVDVAVRTTATYRVAGYADSLSASAPLAFGDAWYDVETATDTRRHDRSVERTVAVPGSSPVPPWALAGVGGLLALAALLVAAWYRAWRPALPRLAEAVHRHRHDEWISTGRVPDPGDALVVETATLEDLVDVGIDAGARVIHDPERGRYVVVTPAAHYRYDARVDDDA
ncbi:DUF5305 family protein [Halarchaeum nitratireducens]|uniref:DUF5305 family protein n=1 Tax=Halarchaeum nitratireducens TaxID=489913 RepID=UPI001664E7DC|nr:DUF5305 family protein [Halarchaeum nitratireducens]